MRGCGNEGLNSLHLAGMCGFVWGKKKHMTPFHGIVSYPAGGSYQKIHWCTVVHCGHEGLNMIKNRTQRVYDI